MVAPLLSYFVMAFSSASVTPKERSAMVSQKLEILVEVLVGSRRVADDAEARKGT